MTNLIKNIRWLWSHLDTAKGLLLLSSVLMAIESFFNLAAIGLQQTMIDDVLIGGDHSRFWMILLQIIFAYLIFSILFVLAPHIMHYTMARTRLSMAKELMESMYHIPIGKLRKERTANYVYYFSKDMEVNYHIAASDLPRFIQQLVTVLIIIIVIAVASPTLLCVMMVMVSLYIILGRKFGPPRKKIASEINENQSSVLVHLEEGVSATREVIAFNRHDWEEKSYQLKFQNYFSSVMKEGRLINKQLLLSDPLKWGVILFVLLYGGILVLNGSLTIGMFVIVFQFASRFMDSVGGLYEFVMGLSGKMASVDRVRAVLEGEKMEDGTKSLSNSIHYIHFEDVSFQYEDHLVLKRLTTTISAGKKTALVGSSGGGKSTIANLLVRFFEPSRGEIYVDDIPLKDIRRSNWLQRVTLVSQEPYLLPDTIRNNLMLGQDDICDELMIRACKNMQIHELIMSLPEGYNTVIGERGVTLSGGQRQLLALARAVLRDTDILILDEATSSLDLETERKVQKHLDLLRKDKITLIIAHRLSTIQNADLILVMDQGVVAEQGNHDTLLQNQSIYRELVYK